MPRSSRYRMTPPAASSPKALPPASTMAWMTCAAASGLSSSLSREAGPPPRTSSPAGAPSLPSSTTVQPVPAAVFSAWPIWRLSKDVMGISFMGVSFPRMPLHHNIDHCTPPAPPAQQKIPLGVRPRRDGKVRGYSNSTNPIIWDCIFYVFTDKLFANLLMFHLLFLAAQFLSIKIVSQKAEKCNHIPRLFQITSHFSLILFFDMF